MKRSIAIIACVVCTLGYGADPKALRQQRFELLEARTAALEARVDEPGGKPLERGKLPILRWSNPVREYVNDGLTYLWLEGNRPVFIGSWYCRSNEADLTTGELMREFSSLTDKALTVGRQEETLWTPQAGGIVNRLLAGAPAPQDTAGRRLTQMRQLARRFQAVWYNMDSPHELRLMPQPLYRYEDKAANGLDGALFAFVEGNDPEALLLLEAQADKWTYTLARMTSYGVTVRLDDDEVFTAKPYWRNPRSPADPYSSATDGRFDLEAMAEAEQKPALP